MIHREFSVAGIDRVAWREAMARKYPTQDEARMFVSRTGLNPARIAFQPRADLTWYSILDEAQKQGPRSVQLLIKCALEDFPEDDGLRRLLDGAPVRYAEGPVLSEGDWRGRGTTTLEKLMGNQSALVPVSFLEVGLRRARAVVRFKGSDGSLGSGFLIPGDLLVTNRHILPSREDAAAGVVQFNYQKTVEGHDAEMEELGLDPDVFFLSSGEDDFTVVRVKGEPTKRWGAIEIGDARIRVGDRVNIIQHPGGEQKQLSFFHNLVEFVGQGRVQYLTDTLPGSSGAPVFDKEWRLVALHRSGGWIPEPGSKEPCYRNEGVHVERLLEALRSER
jgi:V8-like Glu-specific endopeptidase